MPAPKSDAAITIPAIKQELLTITIIGDTPLIMHKWSEKAKKMIRDKQGKKATAAGREAKDPEQEMEDCIYHLPGGQPAFPAAAFKKAAVRACKPIPGIDMIDARGWFYVIGDPSDPSLVAITADKPIMREDPVPIGQGTDLRYRPEFRNWSAVLNIRFNENVVSAEQICNLISLAGFHVGVGEMRPEKPGGQDYGLWHVQLEQGATHDGTRQGKVGRDKA